jgi:hypothetical protein
MMDMRAVVLILVCIGMHCAYGLVPLLGVARKFSFDRKISPVRVWKGAESDSIPIAVTVRKQHSAKSEHAQLVAYDTVYKESVDDKVGIVMDSPAMKVLEIVSNPIALVFALYFVLVGYTQVGSFFNGILSALRLRKRDKPAVPVAEMPFQVFECAVCEMQMRPARGRAAKIFGKERFRCARCGARASSYFDIDDLTDARAVARRERLAAEEAGEDGLEDEAGRYEDDGVL